MIGHNRIMIPPQHDQGIKGADSIHLPESDLDIFFAPFFLDLRIQVNKGAQGIPQDQNNPLGIINPIVKLGVGDLIVGLHQQAEGLIHELLADDKGQHVVHIIRAQIENGLRITSDKIGLVFFQQLDSLFVLIFAGWKPPAVGRKGQIRLPGFF
jgi:hypothetical protein